MKHTITTDRILEASKSCPDAKIALEILFPEAFEDNKIFCNIQDVFVRKNQKGFYKLFHSADNTITLQNINHNTLWSESIPCPWNKFDGTVNMNLTRAQFRKLCKNAIDDFIIVQGNVVYDYYNRINNLNK